jgi:FG-GAP repeat
MRHLLPALSLLYACNEPPGAPTVSIAPDAPDTTDELQVVILGEAIDPDSKDEISYSIRWFQDGTPREDLGETVAATETTKGGRWSVVVTPFDGTVDGTIGEAETFILNTPPVLTASLSPTEAYGGDAIDVAVETTDLDEDTVAVSYSWSVDGVASSYTEAQLPAGVARRDEEWTVMVTPDDGEEAGESVELSVSILNSAPALAGIVLGPDPATESDLLVAVADAPTDLDDDAVTLTWSWTVNGVLVDAATDDSLSSSSFSKHDEVVATATPSDGTTSGDSVSSNTLVIANSAPQVVSATIDPAEAVEGSTLSCLASGWFDADDDPESYATTWTVNGVLVESSETLDGLLFDKGDVVSCSLTPDDGEEIGATVESDAILIGNTAPTLGAATLSSTSPTEDDSLSVSLTDALDDDGDDISFTYAWTVDGTVVAATATVSGVEFSRDQLVYVDVTPWDGEEYGATVRSDVATVQNSAPGVSGVVLTPDPVTTDDTLSASIVSTDADGDSVSHTYAWTVDGSVVSTAETLSGSLYFNRGDDITLTVTPSDGTDSGAPVTSATLTVSNSPPAGLVLAISPSSPSDDDVLVCAIDTTPTDPDGDTVTTTVSWTRNGVSFTGTSTTALAGDTVASADTEIGDVFICTGTTSDGTDSGTGDSISATVGCGGGCGPEGDLYMVAADLIQEGVSAADVAGWAVAMGDVDGDGFDDTIVGAYGANGTGLSDAGRTYVTAGGTTGSRSLGSADAILTGATANAQSAFALAAGDLDDDGVDDLVIGAPGASSTFLVLGPVTSNFSLSAADAVLTGSAAYAVGEGDFDGDGEAEAVTADYSAGKVYVSPLPASSSATVTAAASLILSGETSGDYAGRWVSSGDSDGDGLDDLLVGATYDKAGGTAAGAAYLVLGGSTGSVSLSAADSKLVGESAGDAAGRVVAMGDLDGDGLSDLVIGAPGVSTRVSQAGAVYVVWASSTGGTMDLSAADAKLWGAGNSGLLSYERSLAIGDLDADGHDDLVVGDTHQGAVLLFYGPLSGSVETSEADALFYEESVSSGATLSGLAVGDANGDGAGDLLIGGYIYSPSASTLYAGKAWLFMSGD